MDIVLKGIIVHGKGLGRTVGLPTANLKVTEGTFPENGVYATLIEIDDEELKGKVFSAVTNIGNRPSVDDSSEISVESHILDFCKDIYGKNASLTIKKFLRPIKKFSSLEEVKAQVEKDILESRKC